MKEAYSTKEFAELMGLSERMVKIWVKEGKIKSFKLGRLRKIPVEEFDRLKKEGI